MRLEVEFVPSRLRYSSFYKVFSREEWDRLRDETVEKNGGKCQICGETRGIMNFDAIWSYDDEKHIQKLEGFTLLCDMCHYTKNIGVARVLADSGLLDYNKLITHFCKANKCSRKEFEKSREKALKTWEKRSHYKWKRDLGKYQIWKKRPALTKALPHA